MHLGKKGVKIYISHVSKRCNGLKSQAELIQVKTKQIVFIAAEECLGILQARTSLVSAIKEVLLKQTTSNPHSLQVDKCKYV